MYVHSRACISSSQPWVPAEGIQDKDSVLVLHRSRFSNTMIRASFSCRVELGRCSAPCTGVTPTWVLHTLLGISKTRWRRDRVKQALRAMLHVRKWSFPGKCRDSGKTALGHWHFLFLKVPECSLPHRHFLGALSEPCRVQERAGKKAQGVICTVSGLV